jgi:phage shock protein A
MPPEAEDFQETTPIDFKFATFGELARVFGDKRAHALVRAVMRSEARPVRAPGTQEIEMALRFLRGETTGLKARAALNAFRSYFTDQDEARKTCEAHLENCLKETQCSVEALDLAYRERLEALRIIRRSVADVMTSRQQLELQRVRLLETCETMQSQVSVAQQQNRGDLVRAALLRAQQAKRQADGLGEEIERLSAYETELGVAAHELQAKAEALRTQREILKAEDTIVKAWAQIGETATSSSEPTSLAHAQSQNSAPATPG